MYLFRLIEIQKLEIAVPLCVCNRASQGQPLALFAGYDDFYENFRSCPRRRTHGVCVVEGNVKPHFARRLRTVFPAMHSNRRMNTVADQLPGREIVRRHITVPNLSESNVQVATLRQDRKCMNNNWSPVPVHNANHNMDAPLDVLNCIHRGLCIAEKKLRLPLLLIILAVKENDRDGCRDSCGPAAKRTDPFSRAKRQFGLLICGAEFHPIRPEIVSQKDQACDQREQHRRTPAQVFVTFPHARMPNTATETLARAA